MADMKQIHEFAVKWIDKFRDQKINYIELVDHYMADDCTALGFEMDCGHAFERVYGAAVNNSDELEKSLMTSQIFHCLVLLFTPNGDILTTGHTQVRKF